ncbi:MAG: hypothetical protein NTV88_03510, partial [Candidatus Micrarchaeota archaeon]|nr:hypothetical protein [Candidatus Micrarchaeota archaeon]
MTKKLSLEDMQKIAKSRGGECLSLKYINSKTSLLWQCKFGHTWSAMPVNIKSKKSWCPHCAHLVPLTLEEMQQIAATRGGKCLSNKYLGFEKKLRWKCSEGHGWENTPGHIKSGQWCPVCANNKRGVKKWSDDETKLLIEKYPTSNKQELIILFPNKTCAKIKSKAKTLKLVKRYYPLRSWKKDEDNILKKIFYDQPKNEVIRFMPNRTWSSIQNRAHKLGISRSLKFQKESMQNLWKNEDYAEKMKNLWKNDEYAKKTKIGQKKAYLRNKENIDKRNR